MPQKAAQGDKRRLLSIFFFKLLAVIFLVEFMKGSLLISILPVYMKNALGASGSLIGAAFALQYLGDNLFRSPAGFLAERWGYRITLAASLALTVLSVLIITFVGSPVWITLACLLLGIGTAPLWPCAMAGGTESTRPNSRSRNGTAIGALETASLVGTGSGPVTMNLLVDHASRGYRTALYVLIGISLAAFTVALMLPGRLVPTGKAGLERSSAFAEGVGTWLRAGWARLAQGTMSAVREIKDSLHLHWLVYPALFLQSSVIGLLSPIVALYATNEIGVSPNQFSLLLVVGGGITVLALIPAGRLVDKYGTAPFLNAGLLLGSLTLLLFTLFKSLPAVFAMIAILGIGYAMILPAWNTFVASLVPAARRGVVWGFFLTLQGSGMVVGSLLSGWLWDRISHGAPFVASGAAMLALLAVHAYLTRRGGPLRAVHP